MASLRTSTPLIIKKKSQCKSRLDSHDHDNSTKRLNESSTSNDSFESGDSTRILRDIGNFKDSINDAVNEQNEHQKKEIEELRDELKSIQEQFAEFKDKVGKAPKASRNRRLPKGLSKNVHSTYDSFDDDSRWIVSEPYRSEYNAKVTREIFLGIKDHDVSYEDQDIYRAIYRYFEHLRREERLGGSLVTTRRRTARRHRLFNVRSSLTFDNQTDQSLWERACPYLMSDEETDEEEGVVRKRKVFKTVYWRSDEMNEIISRIDSTLGIKRFYKGRTEREVDLHKVPREVVSPEYL